MKKPWVLSYLFSAQRRPWSDWADAQADLSFGRTVILLLYPPHLCGGVYNFCLSVRPFVRSYVRSFVRLFVRSFVRDSVPFVELLQSFTLKFLKWGISHQLLTRKHSYLDHRYPGGSAFSPWLLTPGSMPQSGARGQNQGHIKKCFSTFLLGKQLMQIVDQTWLNFVTWTCESWSEGQHDLYISRSSDFALYLENYLMYEHHTLGLWVSMTRHLTSK